MKKSAKGIVYITLSIDGNLMGGNPEAIEEAIGNFKILVSIKVVKGLKDYLTCEVKFSPDKQRIWLGQPNLIKRRRNLVIKLQRCKPIK